MNVDYLKLTVPTDEELCEMVIWSQSWIGKFLAVTPVSVNLPKRSRTSVPTKLMCRLL